MSKRKDFENQLSNNGEFKKSSNDSNYDWSFLDKPQKPRWTVNLSNDNEGENHAVNLTSIFQACNSNTIDVEIEGMYTTKYGSTEVYLKFGSEEDRSEFSKYIFGIDLFNYQEPETGDLIL